jgi:hypothetical protein
VVQLAPQQLERAQVIPHPSVNPTARAAFPGKPVTTPPVRPTSLASARSAARGAPRSALGYRQQPAPLVPRNSPPTASAGRPLPSTSEARIQPPTTGAAHALALPSPARSITRSAPPPPSVPFVEQRRSMYEHPGRPLEPQQLENLRAGRASGPMVDREFPPHPAPIPRRGPMQPPVPSRGRKP